MAWYLNPALTQLRNEINAAYPHRDKASDGTIGDSAHQGTSSDHNPDVDGSVDAFDCDKELNGKGKPYAGDVEFIIGRFERHVSSMYWIYNRQVAKRSTNWRRDLYTGSKPHNEHIHFNTREEYENISTPFGIVEGRMSAQEIWAYVISSPGAGITEPASEWLKQARLAAKAAESNTLKLLPMIQQLLDRSPVELTEEQLNYLAVQITAALPPANVLTAEEIQTACAQAYAEVSRYGTESVETPENDE